MNPTKNFLHFEDKKKSSPFKKDFYNKLLNSLLKKIKFKSKVELGLIIVSIEEIQSLNKEHRGINKATDVLSFPMDTEDIFDKVYGFKLLGDIYMSDVILMSQAQKNNNALKWEYGYMFLHSVLHLFGYDHITKKDKWEMDLLIKDSLKDAGVDNEKNIKKDSI